jgi:hypothetical protein
MNINTSCTGIQVNAAGSRRLRGAVAVVSLPGMLLSPLGRRPEGIMRDVALFPQREASWPLGLAAIDNRPHIEVVAAERRAC